MTIKIWNEVCRRKRAKLFFGFDVQNEKWVRHRWQVQMMLKPVFH